MSLSTSLFKMDFSIDSLQLKITSIIYKLKYKKKIKTRALTYYLRYIIFKFIWFIIAVLATLEDSKPRLSKT